MSRRELAETGTCAGRCREWCRGCGMTDLVRRRYGPRARKRRSWNVKRPVLPRFRQLTEGASLLLPQSPSSCTSRTYFASLPCLRHLPFLYYLPSCYTSCTRHASCPVSRNDSISCRKSSAPFVPRSISKHLCSNKLPTSLLPTGEVCVHGKRTGRPILCSHAMCAAGDIA